MYAIYKIVMNVCPITVLFWYYNCRPSAQKVMNELEDLIGTHEDPYSTFDEACSTKLDLIQMANRNTDDLSFSGAYATLGRHDFRARQLRVSCISMTILELY